MFLGDAWYKRSPRTSHNKLLSLGSVGSVDPRLVCRSAARWICRSMELYMDGWICRSLERWIDNWIWSLERWICRSLERWTFRSLDHWIYRSLEHWIDRWIWSLERWICRSLGRWTCRSLDSWICRSLDRWIYTSLHRCIAKRPEKTWERDKHVFTCSFCVFFYRALTASAKRGS